MGFTLKKFQNLLLSSPGGIEAYFKILLGMYKKEGRVTLELIVLVTNNSKYVTYREQF